MIEEIIYTSAQKGLKAGSRGFCTVVSTAGMALNTAERLESMSGYRHAFPMHDPRAQHNPVNYSHVTLRIGGKNTHVISRISDAGQDYSGRTNKLAHHLMFDDVSRLVVGPARLMAENGVFATQWDGNVRNVPPRNLSTPAIPKSVELKVWKTATGDSGWAGWVAEHLMKDKAPVSVIFAAGTDTLTLVREVLDLLPPTQRWGVTFSTYFTKLLAGTECQLRFVLDDTPEVTSLRNDARAKVVDLTKGLSAAQGGLLVEQARTGRVQFGITDVPEPRVPNRSQPQVQAEPLKQVVPALARNEESAGSGSLPEIPMLNARAPAIPIGSRTGPPELFVEPIQKRRRWTWILYAVGSLLLMVVASGVTFFVVTKTNGSHRGLGETPVVVSKLTDNAAYVDQQKTERGSNNVTNAGGPRSDAKQNDQSSNSTGTAEATPRDANAEGSPSEKTQSESTRAMEEPAVKTEPPLPKEGSKENAIPEPAIPDPFALVLDNPKFKYPRHDLLLFNLPDCRTEEKCRMPLILQDGDEVTLVLHAGFSDLVDGRFDSGMKGDDLRLSPSTSRNAIREWNAEFFRDNESSGDFGVYKLSAVSSLAPPSVESATHNLDFTAGDLFKSTNGTERELANTFQMCPLVVVVTSKSHAAVSKVFGQSCREPHVASSMSGNWRPTFTNNNPLHGLGILSTHAVATWKMYFEIIALDENAMRIVHRFPFSIAESDLHDKKKEPQFKSKQAVGKLYSAITQSDGKDAPFYANEKDADGQHGFVEHTFDWKFEKEGGGHPNVAGQYSVENGDIACLQLPWMPDSDDEKDVPSSGRFLQILNESTNAYSKPDWHKSLEISNKLPIRLRTSSISDDVFKSNADRLSRRIIAVQTALENAKKQREEQIQTEKDKGKEGNTKNLEDWKSEVSEITSRIEALKKFSIEFSLEHHKAELEIFKASLASGKSRQIGYEIAIDLEPQEHDGIVHPATTLYLVETIFSDEQQ